MVVNEFVNWFHGHVFIFDCKMISEDATSFLTKNSGKLTFESNFPTVDRSQICKVATQIVITAKAIDNAVNMKTNIASIILRF